MHDRISRRRFLGLTGTAFVAALAPGGHRSLARAAGSPPLRRFFVGTYTGSGSEGIYACTFDPAGGGIRILGATGGIEHPSFLAADPGGRLLFAVSETGEYEGKPGGSVHAFSVDATGGRLTHVNARPSHGADPAHLSVDAAGRFVLVANYSGGNVCVFPVLPGGRLGDVVANVQHTGSGPDPKRQRGPHAHSVILDPSNSRAFAADLGIDRVMVYAFDRASGALAPAEHSAIAMRPGAGPRHLAFSPDGRRLFVVNELDSTVTALAYDAGSGALSVLGSAPTLPGGFAGANSSADIHVHPSGGFVYASNRGHDSVAVFRVDDRSGALRPVQHQSTLGRSPRNFAIDPSGRFLLAANQRSDSIVVMHIDANDGTLTPAGATASIPSPVCIRFMPGG